MLKSGAIVRSGEVVGPVRCLKERKGGHKEGKAVDCGRVRAKGEDMKESKVIGVGAGRWI